MNDKAEQDRPIPLRTHRPAGAGDAAPRRTDAPRPGNRRPPLRHSILHPPPGLGGHACWSGLCAIAAMDSPPSLPSPARTAVNSAPSLPKPPPSSNGSNAKIRHRTGTALLRALGAGQSSRTKPAASRPPPSTAFCAPADSPNVNCCSTKPPRTKSTKPSSPIRPGSPTCCSVPGSQRAGGGKMQVFLQATLDDASRLIPHAQFYPNQGLDSLSRLPAPSHRRARPAHAPLHGQRQDLSLAAVGAHRRLHRHPHHSHAALSARRPRQNRTLLPFRARAVSRRSRSQSPAVARTVERAAVALARYRLPSPRAQRAPDHAAAALAARHRNRSGNCRPPPTCAACSFIASTVWCAATPRSCCATASLKRRRNWPANASRCDSIRSIWPTWRSTATANPEGVARLVDAVVNGRTYR